MSVLGRISLTASSAGVGALAGLVGTAAMTVSSTLEAKLRGRGASSTPAQAVATVLGVEPKDEAAEERFSEMVHWVYGTSWGVVRGLLGAAHLRGMPAFGTHLALVWGGEQVVLPATGTTGPAWDWGVEEASIDLLHHVVYAATTSAVYALLDPAKRLM